MKTVTFDNICSNYLFFTLSLMIFLFEAVNTCYLLVSKSLATCFAKYKMFEKSKMAAKMTNMWNGCCHSKVFFIKDCLLL